MGTMVDRLLEIADNTLADGVYSRTSKRRAVSTAYYAVFHSMARLCADVVTNATNKDERATPNYERVYRSLNHGPLRSAFDKSPLKDSPNFRKIGTLIATLQSERHKADYMPSRHLFSKAQTALLIDSAREAIKLLNELNESDRQTLVVSLLLSTHGK